MGTTMSDSDMMAAVLMGGFGLALMLVTVHMMWTGLRNWWAEERYKKDYEQYFRDHPNIPMHMRDMIDIYHRGD